MATKAELLTEAQALDIEGRSEMNKAELEAAIEAAKAESPEVEEAVEAVEEAIVELAVEASPEAPEAPEAPAVEEAPVIELVEGPVISRGETLQGGLTFLTDRSQ